MERKMRILITTGIYPPAIGGPAQYAKNLADALRRSGHDVTVKTYTIEHKLPPGIRHLTFFFKALGGAFRADKVIVLDTFSVGVPTIAACRLLFKRPIIRTGGDFLWESYVERTKKKVPFKNFYLTEPSHFSRKERIIFKLTRWILSHAFVVFSTDWQRKIFIAAYGLDESKTALIENYYGPKEADEAPENKIFIASTRNLVWKNHDVLKEAFGKAKFNHPEIELFTDNLPYGQFTEKMKRAYAIVLVSIGDISPNMILDAIRFNRPFICTKEIGIYDRIKSCGMYVDPQNKEEIAKAVSLLLDPAVYRHEREKVRNFNFTHTWDDIARAFIALRP